MERCGRKRRAPCAKFPVPTKRMEVAAAESLLQLPCSMASTVQVVADSKNAVDVLLQSEFDAQHTSTQTVVLLKHFSTKTETSCLKQTSETDVHCPDTVRLRLENNILKSQLKRTTAVRHKQLQFGVNTVKDDKLMKFYSGLTRPQFNHLFNSLGDSVNGLIY